MTRAPTLALLLAAACATTRPAPAGPPAGEATLAVDTGGLGLLVVPLPAGWRATLAPVEPGTPPSIRLDPPSGHRILALTPLHDPEAPVGQPARPEAVRKLAELAREKGKETAAEPEVPLVELGGGATGWYYVATDKELLDGTKERTPDEYLVLVQGAVGVGPMVVVFTLLDDDAGPGRQAALDLVRRLRHEAASEGPGEAGASPEAGEPVEVAWPGKAWSLEAAVAGWKVDGPSLRQGGQVVMVALAPDGLVLSLVLADADGLASAEACRDRDWQRIEDRVPDLAEVKRWAGRAVADATYLAPTFQGKPVDQRNHSRWWLRDGICVHAHASVMKAGEGWAARLDEALARVRFREPL
jgi:hypothetical protein